MLVLVTKAEFSCYCCCPMLRRFSILVWAGEIVLSQINFYLVLDLEYKLNYSCIAPTFYMNFPPLGMRMLCFGWEIVWKPGWRTKLWYLAQFWTNIRFRPRSFPGDWPPGRIPGRIHYLIYTELFTSGIVPRVMTAKRTEPKYNIIVVTSTQGGHSLLIPLIIELLRWLRSLYA